MARIFLLKGDIANPGYVDIPDEATHGVTTPITKAVFDTRRLQSLGWQPLWHIEEGLRHTVDQRCCFF